MAALDEDERNRIERVFRKELTSPQNDCHKAHRIKQESDELRSMALAENGRDCRDAQAREAHSEPTDQTRNRQSLVWPRQLPPRIA